MFCDLHLLAPSIFIAKTFKNLTLTNASTYLLNPCTLYVNKIKHFIQAKMSFNKNYPWNAGQKNKEEKKQHKSS